MPRLTGRIHDSIHTATGWLKVKLDPASRLRPRPIKLALICLVIFLAAMIVRLFHREDLNADILCKGTIIQSMGYLYQMEADRILNEGGLLLPNEPFDRSDATMIAHPPGYSILMAAADRVFGERETSVRFIQIICLSACCALLFLIGIELLPLAAAAIAGMLTAFSPHFSYYLVMLSPESLAALPILSAVYFLVRACERPHINYLLAAGVSIGLSCWLRANAMLLAPFMAVAVFMTFERGRRFRYAAAMVAPAVVVMAPITIRNWIAYERFIPLSLGAGVTLIEGIGDYDEEKKFNLPALDGDVQRQEAEMYGRPEYADSLWWPDGVERDAARFRRGLAVIRSNPVWFLGVMARRSVFMLRYNDFLEQDNPLNTTVAPTVLASPGYGHQLNVEDATRVWSSSPVDLQNGATATGEDIKVSLLSDGESLLVEGKIADERDLIASPAVAVKKNTDYLLKIPITLAQGEMAVRIATPDSKITLAIGNVPSVRKKKKKMLREAGGESDAAAERQPVEMILPFASDDVSEIRAIILGRPGLDGLVLQVAGMELFEVGPTPALWTTYPRTAIRALQKNVFKSQRLIPLNILGIILLAVARRRAALLILLAVPLYYLLFQSVLHTEYRYTLVIHYFLFLMGATAIYSDGAAIKELLPAGLRYSSNDKRI